MKIPNASPLCLVAGLLAAGCATPAAQRTHPAYEPGAYSPANPTPGASSFATSSESSATYGPAATSTEYSSSAAAIALQDSRFAPPSSRKPRWRERQAVLQGYFGATLIDEFQVASGSSPAVDASDVSSLPVIGGGAQLKLGGDRIDWGVEGLLAFNWRANAVAFAAGGGGAAVAVDVNLLLFELYGGPFASMFLGKDWRLYGAVGPTMQWASYDQEGGSIDDSGTGFGVGGYGRAGLEYRWTDSTMVGLGARYFDSTIDLSDGLGDLELAGTQVFITITQGF